MKRHHSALIQVAIILLFVSSVESLEQQNKQQETLSFYLKVKSAQPAILGPDRIDIDGKLKEPAWRKAPVLTDFIQQSPDEGAPSTEKTEVRILYSNDAIYIGVKAFDSEPDKIKSILARRDSDLPSDWIKIWIDSYYDHRTAFEFDINPAGVKRDIYWSEDSKIQEDWDTDWDVGVSLSEEGWEAEFKIPFRQIRFSEKETQKLTPGIFLKNAEKGAV